MSIRVKDDIVIGEITAENNSVRASATIDGVIPRAADQCVIAVAAVNRVITLAAIKPVIA